MHIIIWKITFINVQSLYLFRLCPPPQNAEMWKKWQPILLGLSFVFNIIVFFVFSKVTSAIKSFGLFLYLDVTYVVVGCYVYIKWYLFIASAILRKIARHDIMHILISRCKYQPYKGDYDSNSIVKPWLLNIQTKFTSNVKHKSHFKTKLQ